MRVSAPTIDALAQVIIGTKDEGSDPYRTGSQLVSLFARYCSSDTYEDFPSRLYYTRAKLENLNGTELLRELIEDVLDPRNYALRRVAIITTVNHLNNYFAYDGWRLDFDGMYVKAVCIESRLLDIEPAVLNPGRGLDQFILEQREKCQSKLESKDLDGAITNARSLVEATLKWLAKELEIGDGYKSGDLPSMFKVVRRRMNMEHEGDEINPDLNRILSGLTNQVQGLTELRNRMSDAHPRQASPASHHARLAVNAAFTFCDFMLGSYEYQKSRGRFEKREKKRAPQASIQPRDREPIRKPSSS